MADKITDDHATTELPEDWRVALVQADRFINNPSAPGADERAQLDATFSAAEQVELGLGTGLFHGFSKMLIVLGQEPPQMDTTILPTPAAPSSDRPRIA